MKPGFNGTAWHSPDMSGSFAFTPKQAQALQKDCAKRRAGGGSGGGSFGFDTMSDIGGALEATHARPRLVLARHPTEPSFDGFWLVGGRLVDWGPVSDAVELSERSHAALARAGRIGELAARLGVGRSQLGTG